MAGPPFMKRSWECALGTQGLWMVLFNIFINEVGREARRDDN